MGKIVVFSCRSCGYNAQMSLGVGKFCDISRLFKGIVDKAKNGEYGEEWRREIKRDPTLVVNVSDELYICPTCGAFTTGLNLALYKPVEKIHFAAFRHLKRYGTDLTLEQNPNFSLYKKYPHTCEKCDCDMIVYHWREEKIRPTCPYCSEKGEFCIDTLWD